MGRVRDILERKGSQVQTIGPAASVLQATLVMNEHKIGALVVVEQGQIAGMFTERDVLQRIVAQERDPARTSVADVMTSEVVCCTPETSLDEVATAMRNRRIRHLPVCKNDRLVGIVSIGDLVKWKISEVEAEADGLKAYIAAS